jgi:20S proteasome subunit beta 2
LDSFHSLLGQPLTLFPSNAKVAGSSTDAIKHRFLKTGTTIVGLVYDGGVVLAADTRSTEGHIVADKNCRKIHYIADNIYCCGAGTAADTEFTTEMIASSLKLHALRTGRLTRVVSAMTLLKRHLYKYQGHVGAALILGGVDHEGAKLYSIWPHGSVDELPYLTMGSGSLAAMAEFESRWTQGMTKDEAVALAADAIDAGILNDMGSGSFVDVLVIERGTDGEVTVDDRRNMRATGTDSGK